jgi:hypothetical protein
MHATQKAGRKIGLASNGSPAEVRMAQLVDETSRRTGLSPDKVAKIIAKRAAASGAASWDDLELVMIQAFSMLSGCDGGLDLDDPNYLAELADFWFREFLEDQELRKAAMSQHVVERPRLATTRSAQLASPGVEWERVLRQTAGLVRRRTLALQAQRTAEAVLARERFAMLRL